MRQRRRSARGEAEETTGGGRGAGASAGAARAACERSSERSGREPLTVAARSSRAREAEKLQQDSFARKRAVGSGVRRRSELPAGQKGSEAACVRGARAHDADAGEGRPAGQDRLRGEVPSDLLAALESKEGDPRKTLERRLDLALGYQRARDVEARHACEAAQDVIRSSRG